MSTRLHEHSYCVTELILEKKIRRWLGLITRKIEHYQKWIKQKKHTISNDNDYKNKNERIAENKKTKT